MKQYALITGASRGLGKALALELAKRKYNLVLVSLPGEDLGQWCSELQKYEIQSFFFETDLSVKENILTFTSWVNKKFEISILINNVGAGGTREFFSSPFDYLDNLMQLNIRTTVLITHQLLSNLKRQPVSYILNVSSMASFSPIGYKTVYSASKRFIHYFSEGLAQELRGTNIKVSVVHPGPMKTNEEVSRRIQQQGLLGKFGLMCPQDVARYTMNKMFNGRPSIIVGWLNRINWLAMKLIPSRIGIPIITMIVKRELSSGKTTLN